MSSFFLLFFFMYILSFFFVLGCNSFFFLWVGLEMNMMSFISLMYKKEMDKVECALSYFFVQSLGSAVFMMSLFLGGNLSEFGVNLMMTYKMGAGPFFFWFPVICSSLGWVVMFFMMTFQKIMPCIIMSNFYSVTSWCLSGLSLIVGVLGSLNEVNLKNIMAYSSIHHVGWLILSMGFDSYDWVVYWLIYSMVVLIFNSYMNFLGTDNINSLGFVKVNKLVFTFILLNTGGMPPFLGFFLKWWVFNKVLGVDYTYMMFLVFFSVMMFYIYLRLGFTLFMSGEFYFSWGVSGSVSKTMLMESFYVLGVVFFPLVVMVLI